MDLDKSLDDIIKRRRGANKGKQRQGKNNHQTSSGSNKAANRNRKHQDTKKTTNNTALPINNKSKAINKRLGSRMTLGQSNASAKTTKSVNHASKLNKPNRPKKPTMASKPHAALQTGGTANLARSKKARPFDNPKKMNIDPANIIITKTLSVGDKNAMADMTPLDHGHLPLGQSSFNITPAQRPLAERGLSFRGVAYGMNGSVFGSTGLTIRGESGPATVVISNLDPATNADDVRMICSQFGPLQHVRVLYDATGRSFGEAEIEFAQKGAALECIARLDNEIADGRVLRATLKNHTSGSVAQLGYTQPSVQPYIVPTRSGFTSA